MTPDRWRRAQEIFLAATERETPLRVAFLDEACRDDPELRREVDSLLNAFAAAPSTFLESPAIDAVPKISPTPPGGGPLARGRRLGPYEILSPLGAGGMGEVYRARDERLGREVAIKVLPAEVAGDSVRLRRFEKEARSASALNHPNIVTIYDIGQSDGISFIAMELVNGQTLREPLKSGALPTKRLLAIATQVADGLARAHEAGIVHRDLKPENVMMTKEGLVKVLDFGLAKLTSTGSGSGEGSKLPTMTGTTPGVIVGTVGYMSPEQANGERVDFRSDQFSFGSILYEMAAGKRAFRKKTPIDTLGAILNEEPGSLAAINPKAPTQLRWIVERCLAKDPRQRYSSTDDLARDLAHLRDHLSEATSGAAVGTRGSRRRLGWPARLGIAALLLAAAAVFLLTRSPKPPPPREKKLRQITSNSVENPVITGGISPDGKLLLYKDRSGMKLKLIDTGEDQPVPVPEELKGRGASWDPGPWFPSSTRFFLNVFEPEGGGPGHWSIWVASVLGGMPQKLRGDASAQSFSPDGSTVAFGTGLAPFGDFREIWFMDASGEQARKFLTADADGGLGAASWFHDGQRIAYIRSDRSGDTVMSRDLKAGSPITHFTASEMKKMNPGAWLPDGRLLYTVPEGGLNECNYWERRLDLHTGKPIGEGKRFTNFTGSCMFNPSATEDGSRFVFTKQTLHFTGYVADLSAGGARLENPRHFTLTNSEDFPCDWTADSQAVILLSNRTGQVGIYKQRLDRETAELIATGGDYGNPRVSPDGKWIVYRRGDDVSGTDDVMRMPITGGASELVYKARPWSVTLPSRSPSTLYAIAEPTADGKQLVVSTLDVMKGPGRELTRFGIDAPRGDWSIELSPDGTRVVAISGPEGPISIHSLQGEPNREIRPKGLHELLGVSWTADGKGLFVFNGPSGRSELFHVDLQGNPLPLWKGNGNSGGTGPIASPDGRHLALLDSAAESNFWMMENP
jgi:serine/threonine protein kinase/Tol biopolymer transport system component